ncbi:MAG: FAD-dependent oxidoreductase, partial [Lachnospiraceae bacterium]|nr:FAD-dependent oxidoreductase [Lachnospiraceae bacterium]
DTYDKLILSPGARPVRPELPGIDSKKIFTLRTVEDTFRIHDYVTEQEPKSALIVGGGYIGIEVAENLKNRGLDVTIIQKPDQLMNTIDYDMACFVHSKLRSKGVNLRLGSNVIGFREEEEQIVAVIESERKAVSGSNAGADTSASDNNSTANCELKADFLLLAIGVAPENTLAKKAGLDLGIKGSILVNDRMETSAKDIYAVGDAVQVKHYVTEEPASIALAGPANKQGRIAADNICGGDSRYVGSMGTSIIKIFDQTVAGTGLTERAAKAAGFDTESVVLAPAAHADYYPGAKNMIMKVIFDKTSGKLLGAQIVGSEGADKRLDVIATAISAGLKATDLKDLELAYAPPFSSAKDPANMAGFIMENVMTGLLKQYHWSDDAKLPRDGSVILLDTRTREEYARGHIEGYVNIPVDELRDRIGELEPGKTVYVTCQSGLRGYVACRILAQNGFDAYNLAGGYMFYSGVLREKALAESTFPCGMEKDS